MRTQGDFYKGSGAGGPISVTTVSLQNGEPVGFSYRTIPAGEMVLVALLMDALVVGRDEAVPLVERFRSFLLGRVDWELSDTEIVAWATEVRREHEGECFYGPDDRCVHCGRVRLLG